jgi:hypothetical protein
MYARQAEFYAAYLAYSTPFSRFESHQTQIEIFPFTQDGGIPGVTPVTEIASKPGEAALHNPGEARDLEHALPAFDDLQLPAVLAQQAVRELGTLVSGIGDDCANVRE